MLSRVALYKYLRYQWFNLQLLVEATSTTRLTLRMCQLCTWLSRTLRAAPHVHKIEIPCRTFPERVGPRILSLESVDYFGTSDYFSGRKKEKNLNVQNFGGEANWSGVVNCYCMQISLVASIWFIFGDDWDITFPWISFIYQFSNK